MTLSEAIRLGAEKRPQCYGRLFSIWGQELASCALGAALETLVGEADARHENCDVLREAFPVLYQATHCPVAECEGSHKSKQSSLARVVIHLNDGHCWTRERIADWVQTVEEG